MKTLGPCDVLSFVAQSHTPCNRCVRFATAVASGHATLATKRTLLLTWAGLPPAGSRQLCLAHSFDHLLGAEQKRFRDRESERLSGRQIDDEIEFGRLLDGDVARLRPAQNLCRQCRQRAGIGPGSSDHRTSAPYFDILPRVVDRR